MNLVSLTGGRYRELEGRLRFDTMLADAQELSSKDEIPTEYNEDLERCRYMALTHARSERNDG